MEEVFSGTKRSCEDMFSDLESWTKELKERHQGLISRASFLDLICYSFMGITSIYFIIQFLSWIISIFHGSSTPPPVS